MPESRRHRNADSGRASTRTRSQSRTRPRAPRSTTSKRDYRSHDEIRPRRPRRHSPDYSSDSSSSSPPPRHRARSYERRSDVQRRRSPSRDSSSSSLDEQMTRERRDQALKSAVTAGAVEAFRQRNRPGEWLGSKGLRVATAAMSAAAIDSAVDKNPRRKGTRNVIGSTLGGLVVDQLANGMRRR